MPIFEAIPCEDHPEDGWYRVSGSAGTADRCSRCHRGLKTEKIDLRDLKRRVEDLEQLAAFVVLDDSSNPEVLRVVLDRMMLHERVSPGATDEGPMILDDIDGPEGGPEVREKIMAWWSGWTGGPPIDPADSGGGMPPGGPISWLDTPEESAEEAREPEDGDWGVPKGGP